MNGNKIISQVRILFPFLFYQNQKNVTSHPKAFASTAFALTYVQEKYIEWGSEHFSCEIKKSNVAHSLWCVYFITHPIAACMTVTYWFWKSLIYHFLFIMDIMINKADFQAPVPTLMWQLIQYN